MQKGNLYVDLTASAQCLIMFVINTMDLVLVCIESCLSWVPEKGTVGASGDLAPLSHLALGLIGEGKMWSPQTGWAGAKQVQYQPLYLLF